MIYNIEINYNNEIPKMTIINYKNSQDIDVEFSNGVIAESINYKEFTKWKTFNPFSKTVFEIGYLGIGKHHVSENGKRTIKYDKWRSMLKRCYDEKYKEKHPTYKDCTVCDEWLCFQNFAEWFEDNYYTIDNERMCLDKDILVKGNKIYSPDTCLIVPERINSLFVKNNVDRGKYPIGVYLNKKDNVFVANCKNIFNKTTYIGAYNTPEEAFYLGYKPFKGKVIKQVADCYKNQIPKNVYDAVCNYKVEITD